MKIFLLFLLTSGYFCSGSSASTTEECKVQQVLLKEIIDDVTVIKGLQTSMIFVDHVLTPEHCTHENFCQAGAVLSEYKAEDLGLGEKDWRLPRKLVAYTRKTTCNVKAMDQKVEFRQLLHNIKQCAQKEYKKPCV
ncbi:hypothetical protein QTP70_024266 [Hemibagrus guttatus]|uniref:Uncharacterized protein n=1 Tax=Hemibagrus guttatus TaxID=175788 RepID=A0AAE0UXB6_9TELE|nr:hypothetical protein QTP70_024266 [Hemibagrus guttatus]